MNVDKPKKNRLINQMRKRLSVVGSPKRSPHSVTDQSSINEISSPKLDIDMFNPPSLKSGE